MPIYTATVLETTSVENRRAILDSIHRANVASGFPEADRFQRMQSFELTDFLYDKTYPDLSQPRTQSFVLIEVILSAGHPPSLTQTISTNLVDALGQNPGIPANDILIVYLEVPRQQIAFRAGIHGS